MYERHFYGTAAVLRDVYNSVRGANVFCPARYQVNSILSTAVPTKVVCTTQVLFYFILFMYHFVTILSRSSRIW